MHILTFDIEDWFLARKSESVPPALWDGFETRVERNTDKILDVLAGHNQKATFFILGWVAQKYPALVKRIDGQGHEIGFHSNLHEHLWKMNPRQLAADFTQGLATIEELLGKKIIFYRAPYFSLKGNSDWAFEIMMENGIKASSSTSAFSRIKNLVVPNTPFLLEKNGQTLHEFPLNRLNLGFLKPVFSGSGYFRILPSYVLSQLFASSSYSNTYFHPRDFDTSIPYSTRLSPGRNILNRIGAKTTIGKIEHLFRELRFITLNEALLAIENGNEPLPVLKF